MEWKLGLYGGLLGFVLQVVRRKTRVPRGHLKGGRGVQGLGLRVRRRGKNDKYGHYPSGFSRGYWKGL